ncbi:unnamed protein product [Angiostrongylus costaricensis]|uniref:FGE-sulfatase domain-containing protein n=1 Tax=Angiostrongylus costaricensis TaxID=334426 RepID=A0A158PGA5_ANGCS|nr:unnamed protein product [Angiostrongylus costaricensis]
MVIGLLGLTIDELQTGSAELSPEDIEQEQEYFQNLRQVPVIGNHYYCQWCHDGKDKKKMARQLWSSPQYEPLAKRAQTFVRFGKRAQTFVRFGKRAQTFVRFGRSAPTQM